MFILILIIINIQLLGQLGQEPAPSQATGMVLVCSILGKFLGVCGNKMPTRCNGGFLLQILLLAQHVKGTSMPIIRSSRVLYSGCCLWYFVLWFSSCWSGVELKVMCLVCRMLQHHANRTHNPKLHPANRTHNPQLHTRPAT